VIVIERLVYGEFEVGNDDECWPWIGYRDSNGYGVTKVDGKAKRAHRVVYEMRVGPIPDGLHIDHLCRNPSCVNPLHLEPVTPRENTLRGNGLAALNAAKTACKNGHEFDDVNTYHRPTGGRACRKCRRAASQRYEAKQ
jgi:hypothetical protein